MIGKYLVERRSWIYLFIGLELLIIFVSFLDPAIQTESAVYIVFLSLIIFTIFVAVRYKKETRFYQQLAEDTSLEFPNAAYARTPLERIVEKSIIVQTDLLKQEALASSKLLEEGKDELLSWIHEVKTPLSTMRLIIENLEDETVKGRLDYEWLRIYHLLDQQLHQKRIPYMMNDLYIENIELKPLVLKEIKGLQSWCIQKGIGFEVDIKAPDVLSDAKWLGFILRQILTNAVKYSDASDIIIYGFENSGQTILKIRDFGRGIDPRDLQRIFDKGFTSTTNHEDHSATGIGLYLVKKAAKPLLIRIGVESKPAEGTSFTLVFPQKNEFTRIAGM